MSNLSQCWLLSAAAWIGRPGRPFLRRLSQIWERQLVHITVMAYRLQEAAVTADKQEKRATGDETDDVILPVADAVVYFVAGT
jgi:hypothetical protein